MKRGELRSEIMEACPAGFDGDLLKFIDKVEGLVNGIVSELDISSISDIGQVETAHDLANDLADGLW